MTNRRNFLVQAPLAAAGVLAACNAPGSAADATASLALPPAKPKPLLDAVPADAPILTWIPRHEDLCYTFGGVSAKHRIKPGTKIVSWTEDCFDGIVKTPADLPSKVVPLGHDNPQTGPFYVEGAELGDTVAIHVLRCEPARDYCVSSFFPGFGAIVGTERTAMLNPDLPEATWRYDLNADKTFARAKSRQGGHSWDVPLAPFLGCLGVAPSMGEARSAIVPGPFGGNMDCWEVCPGNTVYLGVNVPGALLSFGDGHYAQGEGEIMGCALEGAMHVEVYVELHKQVATPVPRIENSEEVMFVGYGRPLEDAARVAYKAMVRWVQQHSQLSEMDAYQFVAQSVTAPILQLVDPEYTVLVKLQKSRMPKG